MDGDTTQDAGRDDTERVSLRPAVPWLVAMLALGVAAVVIGVLRLDQLPDPYPVHFGPAGDPDRFADRSLGTVLMPPIVGQLSGLAVFAVLLLARGRGLRRLVMPLAAMGLVVGGGICAISIAQYLSSDAVAPGWGFWLLLAGILVTTVWVIVASVRTGRETTDDREGWRLGGLVYANSDDPDVFVTKRVGVGTTVNFGRPMGWVVMGLILLPGILIVVAVAVWT
ncbi:DUF1648 domain-containing protein [Janibacter cremeus]|uniref:Putative membrane protein n=1 Tax=Janibacter cremeus TaxID=1285192 RepID=A0A852VSZ0_9MICO|nr:DUF1648 domain-containing protein [Janibacter cremeus]NYF99436.1 putative membrane protein [Janibacter cremeus]